MEIQYDLISIKAVNFFFQAALACFIPFKSIFQKQLGISTTQNGIITAIEKFISLIAPPLIGAISDKLSAYKSTMIACSLLSIAFTLPMYFVPPIKKNGTTIVCCVSQNPLCCNVVENGFTAQCELSNLNDSNVECFKNDTTSASYFSFPRNVTEIIKCTNSSQFETCLQEKASNQYGLTFSLLVLLSALIVVAWVPLSSLIDATTMYMLGPERMDQFGKQRLWGAVGFGIVGLLTGFLIDVLTSTSQNDEEKNYLFAFVGFAIFQVITAWICFKLKVPQHKFPSILNGLLGLVRNVRISCLLLVIFFSGFNLGARYAFMFWYVEQLPGATQTLLGFTVLTGCASEIPTFFVSGWVFNKVGYDAVLALGLVAAALQCFLYTIIPVAWPALFIEMLHGVSFALPLAAMCTYASVLSPEGMTATLIGLTQGVYWGLGNMAGALVSGMLYHQYGAKWMFNINALIAVSSGLIYFAVVKTLPVFTSTTKNTDKTLEAADPMLVEAAEKTDKTAV